MARNDEIDRLRQKIRTRQWERLDALMDTILATNPFHRKRLEHLTIRTLDDFVRMCPLMTKRQLVQDREAHPPYGTNLTYPIENYTRFCQTSGTTGPPMTWLDSRDDWNSMLALWEHIFSEAGVIPGEDRIFFPFSFGPFLGFWTAFEAAGRVGSLVVPGGGMSSNARVQLIHDHRISVLCTTPTYALHLGEIRRQNKALAATENTVRMFITAGEPGGSMPALQERIADLWPGAIVIDHHGLTETGPVSYARPDLRTRLRVMEEAHFAEVLDTATGNEVLEGGEGELVLTTLQRLGCPMIRYRTGDLVRKVYADDGTLCLDGGILARLDDMVCVRGVNIFPTAVDAVLRRFPEVVEYQVREFRQGPMLDLRLLVEIPVTLRDHTLRDRISNALRDTFQLRIDVETAPQGTLPRFEFKARRWIKERSQKPDQVE